MNNKKLDVKPLITHRLSLDEVVRGISLKEKQEGIKHVIVTQM